MKFFYILKMLALSYGLTITNVPSGIVHNDDGVVITSFGYETHVITISFPKFKEVFENQMDKTNFNTDVKQIVRKHLERLGDKLDDHLETALSSWYQEVNLQKITLSDLKFYWSGNSTVQHNRQKRVAPLVIGAGLIIFAVGAILASINTYQIHQMNAIIDKQSQAITSLDKSLQETIDALKSVATVANLASDSVKMLVNSVKKIETRQEDILQSMFILNDISISASIQLSEIVSELDHLRLGRFPYKLLPIGLLQKFIKMTTREDGLSYPLRQMDARVLGVDVKQHEIRILINVPIMQEVVYYTRVKVVNVGYQEESCRKYIHTPKYLAATPGKLIPINEKYCTPATPSAFKCEEMAILSASECWPASPNCGISARCPVEPRERIVPSGKGYLVTLKDEITIERNGRIVKRLTDPNSNYFINVNPGESISVDGFKVQTIQHGMVNSYDEWDFVEENVTNWSSNFSDQMTSLQTKQDEMNLAIKNIKPLTHPFLPGLDHSNGLHAAFWIAITALILVILLAAVLVFWLMRNSKASQSINTPGSSPLSHFSQLSPAGIYPMSSLHMQANTASAPLRLGL